MPPSDVAAIEVYTGSSTPAEFQAPGSTLVHDDRHVEQVQGQEGSVASGALG